MEFLRHLLSMIPSPDAPTMGGILLIVEMGLRAIPSAKPMSILTMISGGLHVAADGAKLVADGVLKVSTILDRVLQNVHIPK